MTRLRVTIGIDKFPIIYRQRVMSSIKEALKKGNKDYKETLFNEKKPRPFTFSLLLPTEKTIKKELIQIDKNFTVNDIVFYLPNKEVNLFLSSNDYEFIMHIYNGMRKLKVFNFSSDEDMLVNSEKLSMEIKKIIMINEKIINSSEIVFKTNSPILIEDKNEKPILPDSEEFNDYLNKIQNKIFEYMRGYGLKEKLEFIPVKIQKQVVKHTVKEFREKTGKPLMFITASQGIFKLKGSPEDLDLLYKIGLGNRTSQGFGMIEVIG